MVAGVGAREWDVDRAMVEVAANLAAAESDIAPIPLPVVELREKYLGRGVIGLLRRQVDAVGLGAELGAGGPLVRLQPPLDLPFSSCKPVVRARRSSIASGQ